MDKLKRLKYLIERYNFRVKLFNEFCWYDKKLIPNFKQFSKDTKDIIDEIAKLKEDPKLTLSTGEK